jgi:hypothetical protein
MTDLAFTPAAEPARLIATRALSPIELFDWVLAASSVRSRRSTRSSPSKQSRPARRRTPPLAR